MRASRSASSSAVRASIASVSTARACPKSLPTGPLCWFSRSRICRLARLKLPLSPKNPRRTSLSESKSCACSRRAFCARSHSASKASRTVSKPFSGFSFKTSAIRARMCADSGAFSCSCTESVITTLLCICALFSPGGRAAGHADTRYLSSLVQLESSFTIACVYRP